MLTRECSYGQHLWMRRDGIEIEQRKQSGDTASPEASATSMGGSEAGVRFQLSRVGKGLCTAI